MLLEISAENPQKSENKFTGSAYSQGFWKQKETAMFAVYHYCVNSFCLSSSLQ